jgi:hypothetical protein
MFRVSRSKMPPSPLVSCAGRSRPVLSRSVISLDVYYPDQGLTSREPPVVPRVRTDVDPRLHATRRWRAAGGPPRARPPTPGTRRAATPVPPPPASSCTSLLTSNPKTAPSWAGSSLCLSVGGGGEHTSTVRLSLPCCDASKKHPQYSAGPTTGSDGVRATAEPLATNQKAAGSSPAERVPVLPADPGPLGNDFAWM